MCRVADLLSESCVDILITDGFCVLQALAEIEFDWPTAILILYCGIEPIDLEFGQVKPCASGPKLAFLVV